MSSKCGTVHFVGTQAQEEQLKEYIKQYENAEGALIPVMQKAQAIYGYLPIEVQSLISDGLKIPLAEVYGVATFYAQFTLVPLGKHKISVCMGTACYVRGAGNILDKLSDRLKVQAGETTEDGKFSLDAVRCIGACSLAPVITIGDDVYARLTGDEIDDILAKY